MNYCVMCGLPVPNGQNVCSMCYGDPEYGRDGYYRQWLEEDARRHALERQQEEDTLAQEQEEEKQ